MASYLYGHDFNRLLRMAEQIEFGMGGFNAGVIYDEFEAWSSAARAPAAEPEAKPRGSPARWATSKAWR